MIDLHKITPLALVVPMPGLFIPFSGTPLMQFTGLVDETGADIYEHDYLTMTDREVPRYTLLVRYNAPAFWMVKKTKDRDQELDDGRWWHMTEFHSESYRIVGNLYEPPEVWNE